MFNLTLLLLVLSNFLLAACANVTADSNPNSLNRVYGAKPAEQVDGPGELHLTEMSKEPELRKLVRSKYGNPKSYRVAGKTYSTVASAEGYNKKGIASWYGRKFHGRLTSSREVYDMYKLTAAHRSLPIPTFARVTNLENGKSIIVKINDRGTFS